MPRVYCPTCRRNLRVPDHLAGRRVTCPGCEEPIQVPAEQDALEEVVSPPEAPADQPLPPAARLGMVSIGLGLTSVLVLCLPFIGIIAVGLSGLGFLLGVVGLFKSFGRGAAALGPGAGAARRNRHFGDSPRDYPLAGIGVCLLALALALLPWLGSWLTE
jgi:hypothetical protein